MNRDSHADFSSTDQSRRSKTGPLPDPDSALGLGVHISESEWMDLQYRVQDLDSEERKVCFVTANPIANTAASATKSVVVNTAKQP